MRSKSVQAMVWMSAAMLGINGFLSACSAQTAVADKTATSAARETIFAGKATIVLPKGFRAATKEDLDKRQETGSTPGELWVGPTEGRAIETEALIGLQTSEGTLAEMKAFNERMHKSYSSWEKSEIFRVNGREWYVFEFKMPEASDELTELVAPVDENGESKKRDDRLWHYISYFTVIDGLVHKITFTALRDDMPNAKKEFQASFDTIEIKK